MSKFTFTLRQSLPFNANPHTAKLPAARIHCDGATFPAEIDGASRYNPWKIRAWVIGNTFGAVAMVFAAHESDALDAACDVGLMTSFAVDPEALTYDGATGEAWTEDGATVAWLGSADEPHCLDDCWIAPVEWNAERDILAITAIVRANAAGIPHPAV